MLVYESDLTQGQRDTYRLDLPPGRNVCVATARLPASALADPTLTIKAQLFASHSDDDIPQSRPVGLPVKWTGGPTAVAPSLKWIGEAGDCFVRFAVSHKTYISWDISETPAPKGK